MCLHRSADRVITSPRTVKDSSVVAVQIFDQRKFKRKDQGFLGVVNVRVSDVLDLELGGHGLFRHLPGARSH